MHTKHKFSLVQKHASGATERLWELYVDGKLAGRITNEKQPGLQSKGQQGEFVAEYKEGWWHDDAWNQFWGGEWMHVKSFRSLEQARVELIEDLRKNSPDKAWK